MISINVPQMFAFLSYKVHLCKWLNHKSLPNLPGDLIHPELYQLKGSTPNFEYKIIRIPQTV